MWVSQVRESPVDIQEITGAPLVSLSGQTVSLGPWETVVRLFLWALSLTFIFLGSSPPPPAQL